MTSHARPSTPPPADAASSGARRLPYYSNTEVGAHNVQSDCWVSFFGGVYDLTSLVAENPGLLVAPILKFAGQDISHWFDPKTREPKMHVSRTTGVRESYCPFGRYLHVPPSEPCANWDNSFETSWWSDAARYQVGYLSRRKRKIRIINMLSGQETLLEVCAEERLSDIRARYMLYNRHAGSYTWKRLGRVLDLERTLEENGVPDESQEMEQLNIDDDAYIPALHVHFNDDLTVD
jgi:hypothetical protein